MMLALQLLLFELFEWMKDLALMRGAEKRGGLPFGAGKAAQDKKTLPYYRRVRI
jgi:hypothetical protein